MNWVDFVACGIAHEPVIHPFPGISAHVVEPELVRLFGGDIVCLAAAVFGVPGDIVNGVAS